jgi:hypothetical protein
MRLQALEGEGMPGGTIPDDVFSIFQKSAHKPGIRSRVRRSRIRSLGISWAHFTGWGGLWEPPDEAVCVLPGGFSHLRGIALGHKPNYDRSHFKAPEWLLPFDGLRALSLSKGNVMWAAVAAGFEMGCKLPEHLAWLPCCLDAS